MNPEAEECSSEQEELGEEEEQQEGAFVDNYEHVEGNVLYSPVNVAGPGADAAAFDEQFAGCECLGPCAAATCPCRARCGGVAYDADGRLPDAGRVSTVYECHENCVCSAVSTSSCPNRRVQRGPHRHLEVFDAGAAKGRGLRATVDLAAGEFVCEYAGEVIGVDEARRRCSSAAAALNESGNGQSRTFFSILYKSHFHLRCR